MLKDEASSSQLVKEIESLVSARGLKVVEATTSVHQGSAAMTVVLFREDEEINTDDLAASYNLIYPRYSIILGERDLQLEVSSPGLQRNLKDVMEFSVFRGKDVRCRRCRSECRFPRNVRPPGRSEPDNPLHGSRPWLGRRIVSRVRVVFRRFRPVFLRCGPP